MGSGQAMAGIIRQPPASPTTQAPTPLAAAQAVGPVLKSAFMQAAADTGTPVTVTSNPVPMPGVTVGQLTVPLPAGASVIGAAPNGHLEGVYLSGYGQEFGRELIMGFKAKRAPFLVLGETGDGKSVLMRWVCNEISRLGLVPDYKFIAFNFSVGTNVDILIGQTVLVNNEDGPGQKVIFIPGMLTIAITCGHAFLGEEMTRANQELLSRFYGILDTRKADRYWAVPEGILMYKDGQAPVHENHWFIGTANPEGGGYLTQRFDPAFRSRWFGILRVEELLADERAILENNHFPNDPKMVDKMLKFTKDVRGNPKTRMSTRELVQMSELINAGFNPVRAAKISVAEKFRELGEGVVALAASHFGKL